MRRHLVTAVTLIGLCVLVVWAAKWGWRSLLSDLPSGGLLTTTSRAPACERVHVDPGGRIQAGQVEVSVFNSGDRQGLASQTLDALIERGFIAGEVGNAPSGVHVPRAQVWTTKRGDARARLVARQLGPNVQVHVTRRNLGSGVDVVLGDQFHHLSQAPLTITAKQPQDFCVPVQARTTTG